MTSYSYLDHLDAVAKEDVVGLLKAEQSYGDSWKKRGGVGTWCMLARKWDRLENALRPQATASDLLNTMDLAEALESASRCHDTGITRVEGMSGTPKAHAAAIRRLVQVPYDIFSAAEADTRAEGIIDDIRDLRRYLMLVEAELRSRGAMSAKSTHRDNKS